MAEWIAIESLTKSLKMKGNYSNPKIRMYVRQVNPCRSELPTINETRRAHT